MATKKADAKSKKVTAKKRVEQSGEMKSASDLKSFLLCVRDGMADDTVAPIYAVSAINNILSNSKIYKMLDKENKELARDIWLRIKQSGMQLKNPPMLFSPDEDGSHA